MLFTLNGDVPSKKNSKTVVCRGSRPFIFPSEAHRKWHKEQLLTLKGRLYKPFDVVRVTEITFYPSTARKSDLTNKAESIMDLLVDAGIIEDDNWYVVGVLNLRFGGVDRENPRAEINIH